MLVLGSGFQKQGEGKIIYYSMHVLVALDTKAADVEGMLLHFLTQETRSLSDAMPSYGQWLSLTSWYNYSYALIGSGVL